MLLPPPPLALPPLPTSFHPPESAEAWEPDRFREVGERGGGAAASSFSGEASAAGGGWKPLPPPPERHPGPSGRPVVLMVRVFV